jgi:hypothetical protein
VHHADLGAPVHAHEAPSEQQPDGKRDRHEDQRCESQRATHGRPRVHRSGHTMLVVAKDRPPAPRAASDEHDRDGQHGARERRPQADSAEQRSSRDRESSPMPGCGFGFPRHATSLSRKETTDGPTRHCADNRSARVARLVSFPRVAGRQQDFAARPTDCR